MSKPTDNPFDNEAPPLTDPMNKWIADTFAKGDDYVRDVLQHLQVLCVVIEEELDQQRIDPC